MIEKFLLPMRCWNIHSVQCFRENFSNSSSTQKAGKDGGRRPTFNERHLVFLTGRHEQVEMIRHQNIFANEHSMRQASLAKLSEIFVDFGVDENGFAGFSVRGDEVERMAGEKPVKTFESGRTFIRVHAQDCSGICRPDGAGEWGGAGYQDCAPDGAVANRNAVAAFSPALADAVGLHWVNGQNETNSEGVVEAEGEPRNTPNTRMGIQRKVAKKTILCFASLRLGVFASKICADARIVGGRDKGVMERAGRAGTSHLFFRSSKSQRTCSMCLRQPSASP